jgi:cytoskeletal protein RodZ
MEAIHVVGLILVLVVGFFAYQWWSRRQTSGAASGARRSPMKVNRAAMTPEPPASEVHESAAEEPPNVPGQTAAELAAKEPIQRRNPPPQQEGIGPDAQAPANFGEHLRHPEQLFHQPQGDTAVPTMTVSDVPAGRASTASTPLSGNQQQFGPESAQNGGAFIGESVFAFDGMEPSGFSAF